MTALSKEPLLGTTALLVEDQRDFADSLLGLVGALEPCGDDQAIIDLGQGARLGGKDGERFEIIKKIGSGAMGVVYLASDRELERLTAIKFVLQRGGLPKERLIADFYQEAR